MGMRALSKRQARLSARKRKKLARELAFDEWLNERIRFLELEKRNQAYAEALAKRNEQEKEYVARLNESVERERARLLDLLPEWRDVRVRESEQDEIVKWATADGIGFTTEELHQIVDSRVVITLRKAMLYDAKQKQSETK